MDNFVPKLFKKFPLAADADISYINFGISNNKR